MTIADSITMQVINENLLGIVQEMQQSLFRTGYSTIIRESQDASSAILDNQGRLISQHVVLPLHMGAFAKSVQELLKKYPLDAILHGDAYIVNHPYYGGSPHASDMVVITPMIYQNEVVAFCANIAHKSDIGGMVPGSNSGTATEIFHEGIQVPPTLYERDFKVNEEIRDLLRKNSRTPAIIIGDISGQIGANRLGESRLLELIEKYGYETLVAAYISLFKYTEGKIRAAVSQWADGIYEGNSWLDNDGINLEQRLNVNVKIEVQGDQVTFDFSNCSSQATGPVNIRPSLVQAACFYCMIAWIDTSIPINHGLFKAINTRFSSRSLLNPDLPAPVNSYMSTAHCAVEAIVAAFSQHEFNHRMAGSAGSTALALGGSRGEGNNHYVQYEIFGGGMGARDGMDGVSGTTVHVSNGKSASIEILESEFPIRLHRFELIPDSGGAGCFRGGLGFLREYEILKGDAKCSLRGDKHVIPPYGIEGAHDGALGDMVIEDDVQQGRHFPARCGGIPVSSGSRITVFRPGGGGLGDAHERLAHKVLEDFLDGYISEQAARNSYGVEFSKSTKGWEVNAKATEALRSDQ